MPRLSWMATKSQKEPEIGLKSSKFCKKKAKPSSRIKKPGIKDKHEHEMAIFNQARGQTWNRSSAETYPPLTEHSVVSHSITFAFFASLILFQSPVRTPYN